MKQKNEKKFLSSSVLDKDYISKIKREFEEIVGDDNDNLPTALEYLESFNDYFLKKPNM